MSDNNRNGNLAARGYYIALILCVAAIGIMSYVFYRNGAPAQEAVVEQTQQDLLVDMLEPEDVPALATQPPVTQATQPGTEATEPTTAQKRTLKTMLPVNGQTISGYSIEVLSYNQTTRDWRVHNGIDLAAQPGTAVCAAAEGKVFQVYEDDSLGHTVVIRHMDGYTTSYSSLTQDVAVKEGDSVQLGQTIGYTGDSALVETTLGSHVHFSVSHYDEPMDPEEFLALGK